ncbi:unnamed protein product [Medioppia subpectinata]|uniref:Ribosomal RNA-processing protein 8 n=1 Tax=Medioppia subpectinata TaxID=1979941 RepID=A0A7R9PVR6_9ACAR|nr:unnamed protein product [Medioppia subpectinata]CAG2102557.1 unnamed protein product [Medioppia subpectinata]
MFKTFSSKQSAKLRQILDKNETKVARVESPDTRSRSLATRSRDRLLYSRFRAINEFLYSHSTQESRAFLSKPLFATYHQIYRQIAEKWPQKPVHHVIRRLETLPADHVIADIGCGERALIGQHFPERIVHSFDLVSADSHVTRADMASLPLPSASCDVTVFCLSLMATNLKHCLKEANRVMRAGARLLIVEVTSRFEETSVAAFARAMRSFGFRLRAQRHLSDDQYFVFLEFEKSGDCCETPPDVSLKACLYKKR